MADEQDQAEALDLDDVRPEDPDGERVGNLTLADLDRGARPDEEKDLVADAMAGETDPLPNDRVPTAPEEAAIHTESQ
jgi:hypothetical protein